MNEEWLARLKKIESQDSTYLARNPSLILARASASHVWDVSGTKYVDLCAGFGALPLGHNHPQVVKAIEEAVGNESPAILHGLGDVYPSAEKILFMETLKGFLPASIQKITLAVTGSQAVEVAIKTAMLATGGHGIISFRGGYHGLDLGVLSTTSRQDFRLPFESWLNMKAVKRLDYGADRAQIEMAIDEQTRSRIKTAAILVEPIQGRGGIVSPPPGWLKMLRDVSREKGILLIFDEVFTGMGRSGRISFAEEVSCDLLCLGKAIGGGMPVSACCATPEVMDAWPKCEGEALHTGTFFGHPLACLVGRITLQEIKRAGLVERSRKLGEKIRLELRAWQEDSTLISDVRGEGLMIALEFKKNGAGAALMDKLRQVGVMAIPCGTKGRALSITPALNIAETVVMEALSVIKSQL